MKKISVIFITTLYLLSAAGISISIHFCCGRIKYVKVLAEFGSCNLQHQKLPDGCCDEKTYVYQNNQEQLVNQNRNSLFEKYISGIRETNHHDNNLIHAGKKVIHGNDYLPPPKKQFLWLLNCSLTWYG
ncbi:MAG: hypothetical protein A2Y71_12350 [Bacteroidetes bacterium RBG_13_42_15]|nr:MAG: hypothetical protein A2Y71_12350 [Bacteroidetes bacterium RBG_13_42_15]